MSTPKSNFILYLLMSDTSFFCCCSMCQGKLEILYL